LKPERNTLELLSIVRTLPNAPDAYHDFSFADGCGDRNRWHNEPEHAGSQESLNQRAPHHAQSRGGQPSRCCQSPYSIALKHGNQN
jgi:hypothetical protein